MISYLPCTCFTQWMWTRCTYNHNLWVMFALGQRTWLLREVFMARWKGSHDLAHHPKCHDRFVASYGVYNRRPHRIVLFYLFVALFSFYTLWWFNYVVGTPRRLWKEIMVRWKERCWGRWCGNILTCVLLSLHPFPK